MAQSKIKARHGIYTGQPNGTTFVAKPHDMEALNSSGGKKIKARTGVMTQEPDGITFESHKRLETAHWPVHMKTPDGPHMQHEHKKKPDNFGVEQPGGVTKNVESKMPFETPKADAAPLRGIKTITESTGLFVPAKSGPANVAGSNGMGKSEMKKGRTDKGDEKM